MESDLLNPHVHNGSFDGLSANGMISTEPPSDKTHVMSFFASLRMTASILIGRSYWAILRKLFYSNRGCAPVRVFPRRQQRTWRCGPGR